MTVPTQSMAILRKLCPTIVPNHLDNQLLQQPPLMSTSFIVLLLVHQSLHVSIFAVKLQLTGTPRNKLQWKQVHMDQNLWKLRQQLNRSWILDIL